MENIGEFSADGYGMAIISTDLFTEYLKEKKCRAKKLLSYFDKNKEFFFDAITFSQPIMIIVSSI